MRGEQTVHKSDLEGDEQAESKADYARDDRQAAIEGGELLPGVGEGSADHHRNQDHSCNCAHAEHQQVGDGPSRIADGSEHEQRHGSGARQAVNDPHCQRAQHLVQADLLERLR